MAKICPVKKAALEIRGGWDAWSDDNKGIIQIDGVDYVCQNAVFLYTIRKMEFARHKLAGHIPPEFFGRLSGKTRNKLYQELCGMLLGDAFLRLDMALNATERAISILNRMVIMLAYSKQMAPMLPIFEPAYDGDVEAVVNRYVEYANKVSQDKLALCLPPKKDDKADMAFIEPKDMQSCEQLLEMELDVIRGVGFREAELVAAAQKLVEVTAAIEHLAAQLALRK